MSWKRHVVAGSLAAGLACGIAGAQEQPPKPETPPAPGGGTNPAAPVPPPKAKESFFGNHFALYLEVRGGPASIDAINNSNDGAADLKTQSELNFNGSKAGEFTVGWTLPRGRGQYLFTYTGIADGDYELDATGSERIYLNPDGTTGTKLLPHPAPWWHLSVRDGQLNSTETPPVWDETVDDANGDLEPQNEELKFPTTDARLGRQVPADLGSQVQTYDLIYRREFGGVRYHARWTAGVRYLDFQSVVPTTTWIVGAATIPGVGFTEGVQNQLLLLDQKTTGWGPVGSGEIQFNFFRRRLQLYGLFRAAYLNQEIKADSGAFAFLTRDPSPGATDFVTNVGRVERDVKKTSWNSSFEVGVRVKIVEGFHAFVEWHTSGYLDVMLLPTKLAFPANATQGAQAVGANFVSRDFDLSAAQLGLSFQF